MSNDNWEKELFSFPDLKPKSKQSKTNLGAFNFNTEESVKDPEPTSYAIVLCKRSKRKHKHIRNKENTKYVCTLT